MNRFKLWLLLMLLACVGEVRAQSVDEKAGGISVWNRARQVQSQIQRGYIERLNRQIEQEPDNAGLRVDLGRAYFSSALQGDSRARAEAEKTFQQVLHREPDNATALAYHGSLLGMKLGFNLTAPSQIFELSQRAQQELDRAVNLAPDDAEVRELRGYFNFYSPSLFGRDLQAVEDFSRVLASVSSKPNSELDQARLHLVLGDTHNKRSDEASARESWRRVLQLAPDTELAAAAEARLKDLENQNVVVSAYGKELVALFGFLIGVVIFSLLAARLMRDVRGAAQPRKEVLAALTVALLGLGWNGLNLWMVGRRALIASSGQPMWLTRDWALLLALSPIPLGLLAAYRFYQAAFMDIALKRGAALLALIALALGYTQFIEGRLALQILRVPNSALQPVLFAAPWVAIFLLYLPLRNRIYKLVDRHLFRRREYAQLMAEFNERLRLTTDEASLLTVAADTLREAFAADPVRFVSAGELPENLRQSLNERNTGALIRHWPGPEALEEALESELKKNRAELALAVRDNTELAGLMMIGPRAFKQAYLSEELRLLQTISTELSRALENLRLHEARRRQSIAEEELRKLVAQSELMALRAQINPHFFFNALNSVASLIGEDPPRAEQLIENLAELFRHAFKPNSEIIPLAQELELIETYVAVEKVRLGDKMQFRQFVVPEALPVKIPALTIQPLIENAIKHGIGRRNEGGAITLSASVRDGRLSISVADTGVGIGSGEMRELLTRGVGLSNVNNRLTKLYGDAAKLKIDSAPGQGATVSFAVPLTETGRLKPELHAVSR